MTDNGSGPDHAGDDHDRVGKQRGRTPIRKTYKLFVGGRFPRSESGRSYPVTDADGNHLAHAARASRKDLREAVVVARGAFGGWSAATAYNRGQVLYRVAEVMEGRRGQFVDAVAHSSRPAGTSDPGADHTEGVVIDAEAEVDAAIDRWVWYAGWTDKIGSVLGSANPVAGPFFNFSVPEPTGVVGILAPASPLLGLVSTLAPALASGDTAVVVAAEHAPVPAIDLAEVLATSDVPAGVANILTGLRAELAPWLAGHMDVNALDLSGAAAEEVQQLESAAAENVKRVRRPGPEDLLDEPTLDRIRWLVETKTVWHPMGV
jgi:acyl-CoA reductase-like NAD-dependent aldehyde dehydrogenase